MKKKILLILGALILALIAGLIVKGPRDPNSIIPSDTFKDPFSNKQEGCEVDLNNQLKCS